MLSVSHLFEDIASLRNHVAKNNPSLARSANFNGGTSNYTPLPKKPTQVEVLRRHVGAANPKVVRPSSFRGNTKPLIGRT